MDPGGADGHALWTLSWQSVRFLPTALLGAALTYLMVETENMIYPALFHFINNFFPTLLSGITGLQGEERIPRL